MAAHEAATAQGRMRIVDAHVHVWDPRRLDYAWLQGAHELNRPMLPGDLDRDDDLGGVVFVEADCRPDQALDEVRWVFGLQWPRLRGVVAAADLRSRSLEEHLDNLSEVGGVVGVRHLLQAESSSSWASDDALLDGLRMVAARGWTFDACVRWTQLDHLALLLEAVPDLSVVVDHLGKPPVDEGADSSAGGAWSDALAQVAARERTFVKLSGLAAEASSAAVLARHADRFLLRGLEMFGAERSMLGSDWPVSARLGAASSPGTWRERVRTIATGSAWDAVASHTAERFYGLGALPSVPPPSKPSATSASHTPTGTGVDIRDAF